MKKKELERELELRSMECQSAYRQVNELRAAQREMVNAFTGEVAQLRYERTALIEERDELLRLVTQLKLEAIDRAQA